MCPASSASYSLTWATWLQRYFVIFCVICLSMCMGEQVPKEARGSGSPGIGVIGCWEHTKWMLGTNWVPWKSS